MSRIRSLLLAGLMLSFWSAANAAAPVMVDGEWLAANLNNKDIVLVDMAADETQYDRFHLPGAIYLPYYAIVKPRKKDKVTLPLSDAELGQRLGQFGIRRDHHVVIYDDMGGLNAGRLFWGLERIGHPKVSVLDGGLVKWILDGRKVVNVPSRRQPTRYIASGDGRDNLASMEDVDRASKNGSALIDARSMEEYVGDMKKHRGGHVAGARWWEWSRAIDIEGGFVRRPARTLQAELDSLGVGDKTKPVIAYCRSGHRAAQTYLTLRSLGYEHVRLYAPSMKEYGQYRKNELKSGTRP
jgi:thiosulfate/3-mercaptopyruvate sulfurtransferase